MAAPHRRPGAGNPLAGAVAEKQLVLSSSGPTLCTGRSSRCELRVELMISLRRILTLPSVPNSSCALTPRGAAFVDYGRPEGAECVRAPAALGPTILPSHLCSGSVPDNRLYKLHKNGKPVDEFGPYKNEKNLIDALVEINRATQLEWGELVVHVYETDATPLGIGRRYLGAIDGGTVLMMGEVDEERVRGGSR